MVHLYLEGAEGEIRMMFCCQIGGPITVGGGGGGGGVSMGANNWNFRY